MSASDAAPLPRLGEVFFDVRGSSRSMRLSWYADTGVAVFSIWQGGMCTGTFRLPIGDLPRMIEILEQGPEGADPRPRAGHRAEQAWGGPEMAGTGQREVAAGDLHYEDADIRYPDEPRTSYSHADIETSVAGYGRDDLTRPREDFARPQRAAYPPDDLAGTHDRGPEYGERGGPGYDPGDFGGERNRGYLSPGPAEQELPGLRGDDAGYGEQRFVPPYVRGAVGEYGSDIPARPAGRPGDPIQPAYRSDPVPGPSLAEDYLREPWPEPGYSDRPQYRLADEESAPGGTTSGRHSPGRHSNYPREPEPGDQDYEAGLPPDNDALTRDYPTWRSR
jgi:hypothetical protein